MEAALETIRRVVSMQDAGRRLSSKAQCMECGAIYPVSVWQNGAVMLMSATENAGGGGGDPAAFEFVCPGCGVRDSMNTLTIDQLIEAQESNHV